MKTLLQPSVPDCLLISVIQLSLVNFIQQCTTTRLERVLVGEELALRNMLMFGEYQRLRIVFCH